MRRGKKDTDEVVAEINFEAEDRNAFMTVIAAKPLAAPARTKRKNPPSQPQNPQNADTPMTMVATQSNHHHTARSYRQWQHLNLRSLGVATDRTRDVIAVVIGAK